MNQRIEVFSVRSYRANVSSLNASGATEVLELWQQQASVITPFCPSFYPGEFELPGLCKSVCVRAGWRVEGGWRYGEMILGAQRPGWTGVPGWTGRYMALRPVRCPFIPLRDLSGFSG